MNVFIRQCRKDGLFDNTIRNLYNGISRIYTSGNSEWNLKLINPISQLDNTSKPKKSKPRDRRLEDGEYEMLVEEAHRSVEKRQGGPDSVPWLYPTLFGPLLYATWGTRQLHLDTLSC